MRFDATILPSIEEIRERCQRDPAEEMGACRLPGRCVLAKVIGERAADPAVRTNVYPGRTGRGLVFLAWPDGAGWLGVDEDRLTLPFELNALALAFDMIGLDGRLVAAWEVAQLCDGIINQREERAA